MPLYGTVVPPVILRGHLFHYRSHDYLAMIMQVTALELLHIIFLVLLLRTHDTKVNHPVRETATTCVVYVGRFPKLLTRVPLVRPRFDPLRHILGGTPLCVRCTLCSGFLDPPTRRRWRFAKGYAPPCLTASPAKIICAPPTGDAQI